MNIINVKPDKDGKLFIKLFGTTYEIKIIEDKPKKEKK